ncbi:hypothetical protein ALT1644_90077 [Alteromonas macleodii]
MVVLVSFTLVITSVSTRQLSSKLVNTELSITLNSKNSAFKALFLFIQDYFKEQQCPIQRFF